MIQFESHTKHSEVRGLSGMAATSQPQVVSDLFDAARLREYDQVVGVFVDEMCHYLTRPLPFFFREILRFVIHVEVDFIVFPVVVMVDR